MQPKQSNPKNMWLALIILALVSITMTTWILTHNGKEQPALSATPTFPIASDDIIDGEIPVGDYQATLAALQKKVDASRFEVKCNSSISRNPDTGKYNLMIGNTVRNRYNCSVELVSKADGSLLYQSPILKPGQYIADARIDASISGTIDASANFIILSPGTNQYMGKVVVAVTIQSQGEAG